MKFQFNSISGSQVTFLGHSACFTIYYNRSRIQLVTVEKQKLLKKALKFFLFTMLFNDDNNCFMLIYNLLKMLHVLEKWLCNSIERMLFHVETNLNNLPNIKYIFS
ncbi:hypothetical protein T02_3329 [Trichinella nativa]|uniref:Uncharacterized protein n=1 Tax=Trichinella nativa TaxID=6335 RepID=A0A0V1KTS1_9BILA|nr:hypothetical protein T02_3329 [Trichinella nativa]